MQTLTEACGVVWLVAQGSMILGEAICDVEAFGVVSVFVEMEFVL